MLTAAKPVYPLLRRTNTHRHTHMHAFTQIRIQSLGRRQSSDVAYDKKIKKNWSYRVAAATRSLSVYECRYYLVHSYLVANRLNIPKTYGHASRGACTYILCFPPFG